MEFVQGFLIGILLTYIVVKIMTWLAMREMQKRGWARLLADIEKLEDSQLVDEKISLRIEKYQDNFFLFDAHTKKFVTQGRDYLEVSTTLKQLFENRSVSITEGDADALVQFRKTRPS